MNTKAVTQAKDQRELATIGKSAGLIARMAGKYGVDPDKMLETLKQTAFRQRPPKGGGDAKSVTNEQMLMLLTIAERYDLDPFTRQLYAFPSDGGISPIVPVDGWIAMINRHPQLESIEFEIADSACEPDDYWTACTIVRKDRSKPVTVREWMKECYRDTDPWNSHPKRMLRHKALIQCARIAFGYSGIFDPDEGERIFAAAIDVTPRAEGKPRTAEPKRKITPPAEKAAEASGNTPDADEPTISADQATVINDAIKECGIKTSELLAAFEIGGVLELPKSKYEAATAWLLEHGA